MVAVSKVDENILFEVLGSHKFWSFRSEIKVKSENIVSTKHTQISWWSWVGWRVPGTSLPYIICAGTYLKNKEKHFWDVSNKSKVIEIEIINEEFQKLFIEVENVDETLNLLNNM